MPDVWTEFSPHWAEHVRGKYTERVWDTAVKMHEEQRVEATCTTCGAVWKTTCASGHVKDHINRFARVHLHRDEFATPPVKR